MKSPELDVKIEDYLHLTQAAQVVREHWAPHAGLLSDPDICIMQALAVAGNLPKTEFTEPPIELVLLCRTRVEDVHFPFWWIKPWFKPRDFVWVYNDRVCESSEEAATILEQAAELVLLRE